MSVPVDIGKEGVAEESPVKESGSGKKKKRNNRRSSRKKILGASPSSAERWVGLGYMEAAVLLDWLKQKVKGYGIKVTDLTSGMALCALIHHYQPDLMYVCVCMFVCACVCDGMALCALIYHYQTDLMYVCVCMFVCACVCGCMYVCVFVCACIRPDVWGGS